MPLKHVYRYVHGYKSERGYKDRLRRDDGKLVTVTRKRLHQLADEHRIVERLPYEIESDLNDR